MKQSKQHSQSNRRSRETPPKPDPQAVPTGFSKASAGFREIGGQVTGFYRYLPGNRAEVMAHFQHREQIAKLCQRLQLRLEAEFDLASLKNDERRKRARRVGTGATTARNARAVEDAAQLDLLDAARVAFSGAPEYAETSRSAASPVKRSEAQPALERKMPADSTAIEKSKASASETKSLDENRKTTSPPAASANPRTLEESLSEIRPLGPASLTESESRGGKRAKRDAKRRDASA